MSDPGEAQQVSASRDSAREGQSLLDIGAGNDPASQRAQPPLIAQQLLDGQTRWLGHCTHDLATRHS